MPSEDTDLDAIEHFIIDNDDLLTLEAVIGRFNLFDALGIGGHEIRHSHFLAFLLDPGESHGQGQLFLKAFLTDLLKRTSKPQRPVSPIELDGDDLQGVRVRREWQHIDLLITCEWPRFAVAIENKVHSTEHSDQLARYRRTMSEAFADRRTLFVYLTPTGRRASSDEWVPYSYADLHGLISRVQQSHRSAVGEDVRVFVQHYLDLIEARLMDDPKLDDLCRKIYKNHRRAIEVIYDRGRNPASGVLNDIEALIAADDRWTILRRNATYIDFIPEQWLSWLPALGMDYKETRAWIVLIFEFYDDQLMYYAQVQRATDLDLRRRVAEKLLEDGKRLGLSRKGKVTVRDQYTRISSKERLAQFKDDAEYVPGSLNESIKKRLDAVYASLVPLPAVLAPLLVPGSNATAEA